MFIGFYVFALSSIFIISLLGVVCNSFLLFKFLNKNMKSNGFQKLCFMKAISNLIICSSFLFWVVPVTSLSYKYDELNYLVNRFIGVLSSVWAYFTNNLYQVCMSCNRFYVLYFPFGWKPIARLSMATWGIMLSIFTATLFVIVTLPEGCGYVYDPNFFVWRIEESECASGIAEAVPPIVFSTAIIANCFNVGTAFKLLCGKMLVMSKEDLRRKRRRWMAMFTQSVIQDCLQLIDTINAYYIFRLNDEIWWQFLFVTFSFLTVTTLDGFVMFVCHYDIHPNWLKTLTHRQSAQNGQITVHKVSVVSKINMHLQSGKIT